MYTDTKVYEGDWYINVDVKHDGITRRESLTGDVTEVIVVARLAAMCGFIMLGCPNSKKKFIFITLNSFFKKKY